MAFQPVKDTELATGYRLIEKLGAGGYGEVWKASAPGGLTKAVKVVFGAMDGPQAEQELKALGRIKEVRHPFLLSLERIDVLDGQLFVVTELADGSLHDRFLQCRRVGLQGIPRDELIAHLRDAAEALDYMAQTHGLQHLDVKPQNLLLVGGRMKVADFGQVRLVGGIGNTAPGVTPVYATPEAFDGRVSRQSDQYSLAVVYQEMLTGHRPFPGTTLMQLAAQHIGCQPSLAPLPPGDQPAIGRALAKVPDHRFPSCLKMIEALLSAPRLNASLPSLPSISLPSRASGPFLEDPAAPENPTRSVPRIVDGLQKTQVPDGPFDIEDSSVFQVDLDDLHATVIPEPGSVASRSGPRFQPLAGVEAGVRPTLFLGIGGLAGAALRHLRRRLRDRYKDPASTPSFGMLLLDADREEIRDGRGKDSADGVETLLTPLHPPEHYRQSSKKLLRWLDRRWLYGIPRSLLTRGLRPLGRLALIDNADDVLATIRETLTRITDAAALTTTARTAGSGIRCATPRVFILASITGGTGGGMLVSLAYGVRQILAELGLSADGLCGMLLHATSPKPEEQEMARVNVCTTLTELEYLSRPDVTYPGEPESGLKPFPPGQAPFEESYLVHLGEGLSKNAAEAAAETVGDYLYVDSCPGGGAYLDYLRQHLPNESSGTRSSALLRTFGLARMESNAGRLDDLMPRLLSRQLLEKWLGEPSAEVMQELHRQAQREAATRGLNERSLALNLHAAVNAATGNRPDAFIPQVLARAAAAAGSTRQALMLGHVDAAFVASAENPGKATVGAPTLGAVVRDSAESQGAGIGLALVGWLAGIIEQPGKRFKAAERTAAFFTKTLAALIKTSENRTIRVRAQRTTLRERIEAKEASATATVGRSDGRPTGSVSGLKTGRELDEYCHLWMRETAEENATRLLGAVQEQINTFLQEISLCCRQLRTLSDGFRPAISTGQTRILQRAGRAGTGGGMVSTTTSAATDETLPTGLVQHFDRSFQGSSLEKMGMFRGLLSGVDDTFRRATDVPRPTPEQLGRELLARARRVIQGAIKEPDAARLFLRTHGGPERVLPVLVAKTEEARPRLSAEGGHTHLIVALPPGDSGDTLNQLLATSLPGTPASLLPGEEEIFFCFETSGCPISTVSTTLLGSAELPAELVRTVMTRIDVPSILAEIEVPISE
jgi:eukaryotic-like serine/threonine-protein kinase